MSSKSNVGGVFSVEMWLAKDDGRGNPPTPLNSVRIPIISNQSGYSEVVTQSEGVTLVEHTLTIVSEENFWDNISLEGADRVGCLAEVELSSRGKILIGWSSLLGYEQPLRLTKVTTQSGESVNARLTKTWVFKCCSTKSLI